MIIRVEETFLLFGVEYTDRGPKLLGAVTKEGLGDIAHAGKETRLSIALFEQTWEFVGVMTTQTKPS